MSITDNQIQLKRSSEFQPSSSMKLCTKSAENEPRKTEFVRETENDENAKDGYCIGFCGLFRYCSLFRDSGWSQIYVKEGKTHMAIFYN